ncbi:hypothetical protein KC341_g55 [Hortaea werneckii]|nr:hypothetical protein KC341_g55 [Hortaea werneckii]
MTGCQYLLVEGLLLSLRLSSESREFLEPFNMPSQRCEMMLPSLTLPSDRHITFHHCQEHLLWRGEETTLSFELTRLLLCCCQTAARWDVGVTRPHSFGVPSWRISRSSIIRSSQHYKTSAIGNTFESDMAIDSPLSKAGSTFTRRWRQARWLAEHGRQIDERIMQARSILRESFTRTRYHFLSRAYNDSPSRQTIAPVSS